VVYTWIVSMVIRVVHRPLEAVVMADIPVLGIAVVK
jgi:hypothetical protein